MSKPRVLSPTAAYHIILKGIDRADVFLDDADKKAFTDRLSRFSQKLDFSVVSYCLMSNHVHLLVFSRGDFPPGELVKRICTSYVQHYFNRRHDHEGSLFQGKFFSRPVADDNDMLCVCRYILNNPLNGGLCSSLSYEFSSYDATLCDYKSNKNTGFTDTSAIRSVISGTKRFTEFIASGCRDMFPREAFKIKDGDIRAFIAANLTEVPGSERTEIKHSMTNAPAQSGRLLKEMLSCGITVSRIARITGITRARLYSWLN